MLCACGVRAHVVDYVFQCFGIARVCKPSLPAHTSRIAVIESLRLPIIGQLRDVVR